MLLLSGLISCKKSNDSNDNASLLTIFELSNGTESASYEEGMWWWKQLDDAFDEVNILEMGTTDDGEPLNLILIDKDGSTF